MAIRVFEELARNLVGDGKSPNLFFVSNRSGDIVAIFAKRSDALEFAKESAAHMVEDRKMGTVWDEEEEGY